MNPDEDYNKIDAYFQSEHSDLQAQLVSWPELLADSPDKAGFFAELHRRYLALRDHIAGVNYALPVKLQAKYQHDLQTWF